MPTSPSSVTAHRCPGGSTTCPGHLLLVTPCSGHSLLTAPSPKHPVLVTPHPGHSVMAAPSPSHNLLVTSCQGHPLLATPCPSHSLLLTPVPRPRFDACFHQCQQQQLAASPVPAVPTSSNAWSPQSPSVPQSGSPAQTWPKERAGLREGLEKARLEGSCVGRGKKLLCLTLPPAPPSWPLGSPRPN